MSTGLKRKLIIGAALVAVAIGVAAYLKMDKVPSEGRMARIMADVYSVDAIFQTKGSAYTSNNKKNKTVENSYHTILEHYGMTKVEYDSALSWYSRHPESYARVYDKLVSILAKREADYQVLISKRDSVDKEKTRLMDSIKVSYWTAAKRITLPLTPKDTIKERDLVFCYDLDSISGGHMDLHFKYTIYRKSEAKADINARMILSYNDSIADTTFVMLAKSHVQKEIEMTQNLRDTLKASSMKIMLMDCSDFKKIHGQVNEIKLIYTPYEITDSILFDEIVIPPLFAY